MGQTELQRGQESTQQDTIMGMARRLSVRHITLLPRNTDEGIQDILKATAKRLKEIRGNFRIDNREAAKVIIDRLGADGISVLKPTADLVVNNHSLVNGWSEAEKAFLLDTALAKEIAHSQEEIDYQERTERYFGFNEIKARERADEVEIHQSKITELKRYQRRLQNAVMNTTKPQAK